MIAGMAWMWLGLLLAGCDLGPSEDEVLDPDADGARWPEDCKNLDPDVHPGADEIPYDDVDNDCDPTTPDDDLDGDGSGIADDCDDGDATVAPGASEVCGDGVMNDCEGTALAAWHACSDTEAALADFANRSVGTDGLDYNYGFAVAGHSDPTSQQSQLAIGAVRNNFAGENAAGGAYLFRNLLPSAVMGLTTTEDARLALTAASDNDCLGTAITFAGDLVGDGYVYTVVGADCTSDHYGSVYIVLPRESIAPETIGEANSVELTGSEVSGQLGFSVASVGDLDTDGYDDVLTAAPYLDGGGGDAGAAYLVWGSADLLDSASQGIEDVAHRIDGHAGQKFGTAVSGVRDVDGDGVTDVLVAARLSSEAVGTSDAAYLFLGPLKDAAPSSAADADAVYRSCGVPTDLIVGECGFAVAGAGDIDEDGYSDLLMSAFTSAGSYAEGAATYLVPGRRAPSTSDLIDAPTTYALGGCTTCMGDSSDVRHTYDAAKSSLAGDGDLNGDGHVDLIIGDPASSANPSNDALAGTVYLVLGPVSPDGEGEVDLVDSDVPAFHGGRPCSWAGWSVAMADMDLDGADEAIIGVPTCDTGTDFSGDGELDGASTGYVAIIPGVGL